MGNCHRHLWASLESGRKSEGKGDEHENLFHGRAQEIGLPVRCTTDFAAVQLRAMRMSHFVIGGRISRRRDRLELSIRYFELATVDFGFELRHWSTGELQDPIGVVGYANLERQAIISLAEFVARLCPYPPLGQA